MRKLFKDNPLFLICILPIFIDAVCTVLGQPAEYWSSGYQIFNEAGPFYPLIKLNPILFLLTSLTVCLMLAYLLTRYLKEPLNIFATMVILIGEGYNSVAWLRTDLAKTAWFSGHNQLTSMLALVPVGLYILLLGWIATDGLLQYLKNNKSIRS